MHAPVDPSVPSHRTRRRLFVSLAVIFVASTLAAGVVRSAEEGSMSEATGHASASSPPGSADDSAGNLSTTEAAADATADTAPLHFVVDPTLKPAVPDVEPIEGSTERRRVGALAEADGSQSDLVLDEVLVHTVDDAHLQSFLDRWDGRVLDSFPPDPDGQDHLVRVDASRADLANLERDLTVVESGHHGRNRVDDPAVLHLLALAASEWRDGTELVLDWIAQPQTITDGEVYESPDITHKDGTPKSAFEWSYLQTGGNMDIGVGLAWQALESRGRLGNKVPMMIVDGGFSPNFDFPDELKIRKADWGDENPHDCTGGTPCPFHGTDVVLAAMGEVGNGYGTAGPAGPVGELIAVSNSLDFWSALRRTENMVDEEHPRILNMSFTHDTKAGRAWAQHFGDRRYGHIRSRGVLMFAAAGNEKKNVDEDRLWLPCESKHVMCVGALAGDSASMADYSNFGEGDSPTTVEIWGPGTVRTINDPNRSALDFTSKNTKGTSVASPFVAGVAALVMAADPSLTNDEVRAILNETANVGVAGAPAAGSQRRVNALAAIARALHIDVVDPVVTIATPRSGDEHKMTDWVDLDGDAVDFLGRPLPIRWQSDRDGDLGTGTTARELSVGHHVITATATDNRGHTTTSTVEVDVVDTPPELSVVFPTPALRVSTGKAVPLVATSMDPDTFGPVADDEVHWQVRRDGSTVFEGTGHDREVPGATIVAGTYDVTVEAGGATDSVSFVAEAPLPGQHDPDATIDQPSNARQLDAYNGTPQPVHLVGRGSDADQGALDGTHLRWVAISQHETKVLCEGSSVPGSGHGGLAVRRDCATVDATLGLAHGDLGMTKWMVKLEVYDDTGRTDFDTVDVSVRFVTG